MTSANRRLKEPDKGARMPMMTQIWLLAMPWMNKRAVSASNNSC
jgi:hypothetical protein